MCNVSIFIIGNAPQKQDFVSWKRVPGSRLLMLKLSASENYIHVSTGGLGTFMPRDVLVMQ